MRWIPFTLLILVGALLEAGNLLNLIAVGEWHIRPAVLIVALVFFAMHCRAHEAIIASFIIGLAMDIAGHQMGPHTFSYCFIGGLLNQLSDYFPARRIFHQAILILVVYPIAELIAYWLGVLKTGEQQEYVYRVVLFTALYSACIGPIFWTAVRRVNRLIAYKRPRTERGYFR
ncbi:MAG: rod shape-determining protein MreD [Phycisphaerae bacterium]|nr:rod shape-determining protein MreD [Phycisphaerae bacterium]